MAIRDLIRTAVMAWLGTVVIFGFIVAGAAVVLFAFLLGRGIANWLVSL